jgi:hypothetical protein
MEVDDKVPNPRRRDKQKGRSGAAGGKQTPVLRETESPPGPGKVEKILWEMQAGFSCCVVRHLAWDRPTGEFHQLRRSDEAKVQTCTRFPQCGMLVRAS